MAVSKKKKAKPASKAKAKPVSKTKAKVSVKAKSAAPPKAKAKKPAKALIKASAKTQTKNQTKVQAKPAPKSQAKSTPQKTNSKSMNFSHVFSPLDDRILVDVSPMETKTAGGLIIVDSAQEKQSRGVVVAVGPGRRNKKAVLRPMDVQMGDVVIYAQYAGTPIEVLGKEVLILREHEVLAILTK